MAGNKSLRSAEKAKIDEFYTQLSDIEKEMRLVLVYNYGHGKLNIL